MLRVMKERKVREESAQRDPMSMHENENPGAPSQTTCIVSHVPISVASSGVSSSESSLSSAQYHASEPLPRQTEAAKSPILTEKPKISTAVPPFEHSCCPKQGEKVQSLRKDRDILKRRRVSIDDGDVQDAAESGSSKRARLVSLSEESERQPMLLATEKDASVLSPLHVFVRQQIEIFEASESDLNQPCPGRRIPIKLGQVGLRCIHCKNLLGKERKKRAVCYPSSVGRVYNSVSDMKWSHLPICSGLPANLRSQYEQVKAETKGAVDKESSSRKGLGGASASTAKYYHDSALSLGMEDREGGIYMAVKAVRQAVRSAVEPPAPSSNQGQAKGDDPAQDGAQIASNQDRQEQKTKTIVPAVSVPQEVVDISQGASSTAGNEADVEVNGDEKSKFLHLRQSERTALLASEADEQYLTPIHCFARRHVEVFIANESDLNQPMPGRKKPIVLGQVGLRCVHCACLPSKERVKRAICYPPTVSQIYHAISNMKHDHFAQCKGLPAAAKEEFSELKASSLRRGTSSAGKNSSGESSPRVSNSTAQYYHDSALRMGLCDSEEGIRLKACSQQGSSPLECHEKKVSSVPNGMAALMIAATDPSLRALHEKRKQNVQHHFT